MINVLFEGWINIPHSYAIVLCFQLVALYKQNLNIFDIPETKGFNNRKINIYIKEVEYFHKKWYDLKSNITDYYNEEYCKILKELTENDANGVKMDLIYRISYPYNISITNKDITVPKCIFYTSEYRTLDQTYFTGYKTDSIKSIEKYIKQFDKSLFFTGPSIWSTNGLKELNVPESRNRVITHGIDNTVYYRDLNERIEYRKKFNISDSDIVLLNMGAFTGNKGIILLIQLINILVNRLGLKQYKIVFKGIQDLYSSNEMMNMYLEGLKDYITQQEFITLANNGHIHFTTKTLTFDDMRKMYNMCDIYISPYIAEGFNLTPLEALACGTHVLISKTGSTKEYIDDLYSVADNTDNAKNIGPKFIHYIESNVVCNDNKYTNDIDFNSTLNQVVEISKNLRITDSDYTVFSKYINEHYSWNHVAELLYDYFTVIIKDANNKTGK